MLHDGIGQRLQSCFACHLCSGATLLLVGQVDVLEHCGIPTGFYPAAQFGSELPLSVDGGKYELAAMFQLGDIVQLLGNLCHFHVRHAAGRLLAVAADEGNCGTIQQQVHYLSHIFLL